MVRRVPIEKVLFLLLRAGVCGEPVDAEVIDSLNADSLSELYNISSTHDVAHILGAALSKCGKLGDDDCSKSFRGKAMLAMSRYERIHYDLQSICDALEQAQIPFIPLKGSVLRTYYPQPWMRTSCDIDILVQPEMLGKAETILEGTLKYTNRGRRDHDVSLFSPSGVHLELHFDMLEDWYSTGNAKTILNRVWEDAVPETGWCFRCRLSDELFYFYHIAHMAKHFQAGGCGVRSFLDIWIMNHRMEFDQTARRELLQQGGLLKFAQATEELSEAWFSGKQKMGDMLKQLQDYILRAGLYGDSENRAALGQVKNGGKIRYILFRRIFLPYAYLKAEYPILEKKKWLMPIYQVVRWCRVLKRKETIRRVAELKVNAKVSDKDTAAVAKLLEYLGL